MMHFDDLLAGIQVTIHTQGFTTESRWFIYPHTSYRQLALVHNCCDLNILSMTHSMHIGHTTLAFFNTTKVTNFNTKEEKLPRIDNSMSSPRWLSPGPDSHMPMDQLASPGALSSSAHVLAVGYFSTDLYSP